MTEQEREEAFAKEIKDVWGKMRLAKLEFGRSAIVTIRLASELSALSRMFLRLYGKDKIDKYFSEKKRWLRNTEKR